MRGKRAVVQIVTMHLGHVLICHNLPLYYFMLINGIYRMLQYRIHSLINFRIFCFVFSYLGGKSGVDQVVTRNWNVSYNMSLFKTSTILY